MFLLMDYSFSIAIYDVHIGNIQIIIFVFSILLSAMQEEALKLVLLALEDGSALSRKVLVLFVVQRLEPRFPQASKTSIGHVVQLLYRASCFKVLHSGLQNILFTTCNVIFEKF